MLLSDTKILQELKKGNIVIEPFDEQCLSNSSYDCRLGPWYYSPTELSFVDITNEKDVREFWGKPKKATKGIAIKPGETILTHTLEVIGGRNGYTTAMGSRSTLIRSGLSVCRCGGRGDVGYISRWTMELHNETHATLLLPVGMRISQIFFSYVGKTQKQYRGKYGQGEWTPEDMLPKPWLDFDMTDVLEGKYCGN